MIRQLNVWIGLSLIICIAGYYTHLLTIHSSTGTALVWTTALDATYEYSEEYKSFGEPSLLHLKDEKADIYRLGIIRAFDGVLIITLDLTSKTLNIKASDSRGYPPPGLLIEKTVHLSDKELLSFKAALAGSLFLQQSPPTEDLQQGKDGSTWIFEVKRNDKYAAQHQWSPKRGPLYDIGLFMFNLADSYVSLGRLY